MASSNELIMGTKSVTPEQNSGGPGIAAWLAIAKNYVEELKMEMRRVTWPNWEQVKATTAVVIASVFVFAAYFALVDLLIGRGITQLFKVLGK
jgi:preprotein translocase subunit SecE